jgi:hypothetical protein
MFIKKIVFFNCLFLFSLTIIYAQFKPGKSVYTQRIADAEAIYFTPENFPIKTDGKTDISDQLQWAIYQLKREKNFGIVFIPEGNYLISKTIYVPPAIRLIGYGKKRPLIILKKNAPGFQQENQSDKGKAAYLFWFTSSMVDSTGIVHDAGAGTFYSAFSNIDLKIDEGNPAAVALRTHFAQHSFIAHCNIDIGNGKSGIFDVGNMIEDVQFFGGDYGIYTTKASPGWQIMMLDTYFEGQRKTAIKTQQAGFAIVRMQVKNDPAVIQVDSNYWEKLMLQDCWFENIKGPAITVSNEGNANMQLNIRNLACHGVPLLIRYPQNDSSTKISSPIYNVKKFVYGLQLEDVDRGAVFNTNYDVAVLSKMPDPVATDIPALPEVSTWYNIKNTGVEGDGITDDTKAIQKAIEEHDVIYVPEGSYRISEPIKLKPNTILIGLHPMATNFALAENASAFGSFGKPVAMVEAPENGATVITGIGLYTAQNNYRAVACKWMAGERSMIDDVKFIGGHGTMRPGSKLKWKWEERSQAQTEKRGQEQSWDTQYWSLWVTKNGGGIFKNIWSASTFATSGFYANNTSTPAKIYALSVEHHVRNEVRFNNVSNWHVYALQLEEESVESSECQPLEIQHCHNMVFANLYMFRVIRVKVPYPYSIRTWDCTDMEFLNVHNYSQVKYTTDNPLFDINTNTEVRPTEISRLYITGSLLKNGAQTPSSSQLMAKGFEFAIGICKDSKDNIYFSEQRKKRIYKWSASTQSLQLLADFPWEPLSLACDSKDNLLVVCRYNPQPGLLINGKEEHFENPPDAAGTSFSGWGNSGFATWVYAVNTENPEESIALLTKKNMASIPMVYKALYPSNRWRDYHDFNKITVAKNDSCWLAPDNKTIIPVCYDLARACALSEAFPDKKMVAVDEYDKRTVQCNVDAQGYLSNLTYFAQKGEFNSIPDKQGNVWIADGEIYLFDTSGKEIKQFKTPERPSTMAITSDNKILYFTGRSGFYRLWIP